MRARPRRLLLLLAAAAVLAASAPAQADHTDPTAPLSPVVPLPGQATISGEGTWEHIANFAGNTGTDYKFFNVGGVTYASHGSLGQADIGLVGQRIIKLVDADGTVAPEFVADHGSSKCGDIRNVSATTGLQHDVIATPYRPFYLPGPRPETELLVDTTDATGRCHDITGGGLELIDVSGLGQDDFEVREVHLTRHNGYSHTVSLDATRPWIVYNSSSDFGAVAADDDANPFGIGPAWIDVMDIRTCLGNKGKTLEQKRALCRPKVFRIPFEAEWAVQTYPDGTKSQPSACHDVTTRPGRIYCAGLNASSVFDVRGLTIAQGPAIPAPNDPRGDIRGVPLPCKVVPADPSIDGASTEAMVTDCALGGPTVTGAASVQPWVDAGKPQARGWKYVGSVSHAGRNCGDKSAPQTCNTNVVVRSDEDVAISHEADPTPDGKYMFVTDERGGGIVPPGATCAPSLDNPYGNGGLHVYDLRNPADIKHAKKPDGSKAIYISESQQPSPTFCTIHVIEQVPDEARIVAAWYSQGVKIVDYFVDDAGAWTFEEIATYTLQPNDIWAVEHFKIDDNPDGTRTYYFFATDIARGVDVFSWTGPTNKLKAAAGPGGVPTPPKPAPSQAPKPRPSTPTGPLPATGTDRALALAALVLLPAAFAVRRRLSRAA